MTVSHFSIGIYLLRYFLTLAVSASETKLKKGYDVPEIAKQVDWINVMAYNLRSSHQGVTGCPTLTFGPPPNVGHSIDAWINAGTVFVALFR